MPGRVIQGFFIGGAMRPRPAQREAGAEARPRQAAGAPRPAFAGRSAPLQARMAPGRPPLAHQGAGHVAQPHGGNGSFEIDPVQLGLARGGGKPLPQAVLAKMEAAFGADFSTVRVHVGPQASRIGAIAFTTGNDLYFAPGRYQPDSVQGQQLIGHELAHVVQQRQGRVRSPSSGVAVVQDRALEAEADRLGMRAASHRTPMHSEISRATPPSAALWSAVQRSMAASVAPVLGATKRPNTDLEGSCGYFERIRDWTLTGASTGIILQHVTRTFNVTDLATGKPMSGSDIDNYIDSTKSSASATVTSYWEWWEVDGSGKVVGGHGDSFSLCALIPPGKKLRDTTKGTFVEKGRAQFIPCTPPTSKAGIPIANGLPSGTTANPVYVQTQNMAASNFVDFTVTVTWDSSGKNTYSTVVES